MTFESPVLRCNLAMPRSCGRGSSRPDMGLLVDGRWQDRWYDTASRGGRFERESAGIRNWITRDGAAGPSGRGGFAAQAGRYHLYVAWACPWSHRVILYRELFG